MKNLFGFQIMINLNLKNDIMTDFVVTYLPPNLITKFV